MVYNYRDRPYPLNIPENAYNVEKGRVKTMRTVYPAGSRKNSKSLRRKQKYIQHTTKEQSKGQEHNEIGIEFQSTGAALEEERRLMQDGI